MSSGFQDNYRPIDLSTRRGIVACRYYEAPGAQGAVVWVGGVGGGWDTPAQGLYPRLGERLVAEGIASLRVRFRNPIDLDESVHDVLAGLAFLREEGLATVALVGHSFGGAVVIQAAARSPVVQTVETVVTLATQSYGAAPASELAPRCSILLLHGQADEVLPAASSQRVYQIAREPKRLIVYPGADHVLDGVADEISQVVHDWIVEWLKERAPGRLS